VEPARLNASRAPLGSSTNPSPQICDCPQLEHIQRVAAGKLPPRRHGFTIPPLQTVARHTHLTDAARPVAHRLPDVSTHHRQRPPPSPRGSRRRQAAPADHQRRRAKRPRPRRDLLPYFPPSPFFPSRRLTLPKVSRTQRYSSYTFSVFATLHLATTSLIPLVSRSVPASESYLLLAREIYQTPLSEPLLVFLPVLAHIGSGVALRLTRRAHNVARYGAHPHSHKKHSPWPAVSYIAISGYVFTVAYAAHVFVNRGLPLAVEGDSANIGLAYVAHGFTRHPVTSWLAYGGLLVVGCGHMFWGAARWLGFAQGAGWKVPWPTGNAVVDREVKKRRRRRLMVINAAAAGLVILWAAGGLGVVARGGLTEGWVGRVYDGLFDRIPGF